jgi:hypothetical protein
MYAQERVQQRCGGDEFEYFVNTLGEPLLDLCGDRTRVDEDAIGSALAQERFAIGIAGRRRD